MARLVLPLILILFVGLRLPPILHQAGTTDEEWFAVPGLTVAREGIPRVPYARATAPSSMFLGADRLLFAMPPLLFYVQAPFFLVLPPDHATARLPSLLAGCVAIWLVAAITRSLWNDRAAGYWAAGIFSVCRLVYFPAMIARPDMLCGSLGLAAVWAMLRWERRRGGGWLILAGVGLGLAGLAHPFALVFAIQLGIWAVVAKGSTRERLAWSAGLASAALATFSLWGLLIIQAPGLFWPQFRNNILRPDGPGIVARLFLPGSNFVEHLPLVVERAGPIQALFFAVCLAIVALVAIRRRDRAAGLVAVLGTSSVYLLIALQGRHPLQGYWCYPVAFFAIAAGWCLARGVAALQGRAGGMGAGVVAAGLLAVVFAPGSGFRATWAYLRHGGEINYNPRSFVRSILAHVPPDARLTVGAEFALDAYSPRRGVLLGIKHPDYFDATRYPYDFAILGRTALEQGLDKIMDGQVVQSFGDPADPFSCVARLIQTRPDSVAAGRQP